ncbi:hypothetical protein [Salmonirosea aquatica]|uniref:Sugar-binding protein n=1 Tax=Salmonirosea aquatica TaxID=2654236 RepID=A0A7C9BD74_9BACT|nr:hypothetical protein [Cytophagaceae bacterium SJW1-29]
MKKIYLLFLLLALQLLGGMQHTLAQVGSVNHATGTLGVNIPIYTLTEGNLSVPISLSYDGSGVLVESAATNVGLNWQLNAGGFISREVRGIPDESSSGFVDYAQGYSTFGYPTSTSFGLFKDFEPDIFTLSLNGRIVRFIIKPDTQRSEVLLLNDNTDIRIEIVDQGDRTTNGAGVCNVYAAPLERILCHNSWRVGQFVVTTPDGIRYYFGTKATDREYVLSLNTLERYSEGVTGDIVAATTKPVKWYMSAIEQPKGSKDAGGQFTAAPYQRIEFSYTRSTQRLEALRYDKESSLATAVCNEIPKKIEEAEMTQEQKNISFLYKCDLNAIESANVKVIFNSGGLIAPSTVQPVNHIDSNGNPNTDLLPGWPSSYGNGFSPFNETERWDLKAVGFNYQQRVKLGDPEPNVVWSQGEFSKTKALNNIILWDKATGKRTGFFLYHGYFKEYRYYFNHDPNVNKYVTQEVPNSRLKLQGVYPIEFDNDNPYVFKLLPGYVFNHNGGQKPDHIADLLPEKQSLARDHWGYFNGADDNMAKKVGYRLEGILVYCDYPRNTDLTPRYEKARAGALSLVRLPTGGTESYEYELHDCMNYADANGLNKVGGLRIRTIRQFEPATQSERTVRLEYGTKANQAVSSGVLPVLPTYRADFGGQSYIHVNAYAMMTSRFLSNSYITYGEVRETVEGNSNGKTARNGYTEYEFHNLETTRSAATRLDAKIPANLAGFWHSDAVLKEEFIRGSPKSVRHYNAQGGLVNEEDWKYDVQNLTDTRNISGALDIASEYKLDNSPIVKLGNVTSVGAQSLVAIAWANTPYSIYINLASSIIQKITEWIYGGVPPLDHSTYRITPYRVPFADIRLMTNTAMAFDHEGQNPIETTTQYEYLSPNHRQATDIKNYRSHNNGTVLDELLAETTLVYSRDYKDCSQTNASTTALTGLYFRDMNVPIEVVTKRKGRVTGGTFYEYHDKSAGREGLLRTVHSLELSQPLATFSPAGCTVAKNAAYQPTVSITDYNERGLPRVISSTREGGTTTVSYGVNHYLPTSVSYGTGGKTFTSTREYAVPLWGVSKVQGVSGSFTSVTYDDLGRPLLVKDQDGNLVKSYKYKEANPQ